MKYATYLLRIVISSMLLISLAACGSKSPSSSTLSIDDSAKGNSSNLSSYSNDDKTIIEAKEDASTDTEKESIDDSKQDASSENIVPAETGEIADNEDIDTSTDAFVDLYGMYDPKSEIVNTSCMDCPLIQVGNKLLYVGEATIQDFIDLGCDFYYDSEPHNEERNASEWEFQAKHPTKVVDVFLEGVVEFELTCENSDGNGLHMEDVVTDVNVVFNIKNTPEKIFLKDTPLPDLHCIYLPGGVCFTQTFDINGSFGSAYYEDEKTEPFIYHCREYQNAEKASSDSPRYFYRYDTRDEVVYYAILSVQNH